jgi:hypothetical protein
VCPTSDAYLETYTCNGQAMRADFGTGTLGSETFNAGLVAYACVRLASVICFKTFTRVAPISFYKLAVFFTQGHNGTKL